MANLLSTLFRRNNAEITRYSLSWYIQQRVQAIESMLFPGYTSTGTVGGRPVEQIENSYTGYVNGAYKSNSVVAACMRVRRDLFRQARFCWREINDNGPGRIFRDDSLNLLEKPWPNGTTGELLTRMITDIDLCGNSYVVNEGDRLRWLRPDWVSIVLSGDPEKDPDVDVKGYIYAPGGQDMEDGTVYLPDEMCHWAPVQDPVAQYRGMSWLTPAIREIQADGAATEHKLSFLRNGATLGPIIKVPAGVTPQQFKEFVAAADEAHVGAANAYRPFYIGGGVDVTLAGASMQQLEFKATQGAGETRIAALAGVHPVLVGLSEGLAGSSLNAGNFNSARRSTADITLWNLWQDVCGALSAFVSVPDDAELWIRERDIPFLREDAKDAAEIVNIQLEGITKAVREGFDSESAQLAVVTRDPMLLKHSGLVSVQLQPPGTTADGQQNAALPFRTHAYVARAELTADDDYLDDDTLALIAAMAEFTGEIERAFNPALHPHYPKGHPKAGQWRPTIDRLVEALGLWHSGKIKGDPFESFSDAQLRKAAKARGLDVKGASREDITELLKADLGKGMKPAKKTVAKAAPAKVAPKKATGKILSVTEIFERAHGPEGKHIASTVDDEGDRADVYTTGDGSTVLVAQIIEGEELGEEIDIGEFDDKLGHLTWRAVGSVPAKKATAKKAAAPKPAQDALDAYLSSSEAKIRTGDFSGLKKVGEQGGANPGGIYEAADGTRWYIKAQKTAEHAQNERMASALYRAAGIDAPEVHVGSGTPGLPGDNHTATQILDGADADLRARVNHQDHEYLARIRKGFAIDAWLANWDVAGENPAKGWDNIVSVGNEPWRIDVGGSLLFRGLGQPKGASFGPSVTEWDKFRDPDSKRASAAVFQGMTPAQVQDSVDRLKALTPAQIRKLVKDNGGEVGLAEILVARRKDILSLAAAEAKALKSPKGGKVVTGTGVLGQAPLKTGGSFQQQLQQAGLSKTDALDVEISTSNYQDGAYTPINLGLMALARGDQAQAPSSTHKKMIADIDRAMGLSELQAPVIVYRGERNPSRNFPPGTWSLVGGMEGMEWTFPAYASTSAGASTAKSFAKGHTSSKGGQPTVLRIKVPKGVRAIALGGSMAEERELLLTRGLKYRVTKDHGVDAGGVRNLDVEVVPV